MQGPQPDNRTERRRVFTLDIDTWSEYFDSISVERYLLASVRLLPADDAGPQPLEGKRLRAICYDREQDVLQVGVGGTAQQPALRYFISAPRNIVIEESDDGQTIVVDDSRRSRTAISVRDPIPVTGAHTPSVDYVHS
jgi:hypothetical protein